MLSRLLALTRASLAKALSHPPLPTGSGKLATKAVVPSTVARSLHVSVPSPSATTDPRSSGNSPSRTRVSGFGFTPKSQFVADLEQQFKREEPDIQEEELQRRVRRCWEEEKEMRLPILIQYVQEYEARKQAGTLQPEFIKPLTWHEFRKAYSPRVKAEGFTSRKLQQAELARRFREYTGRPQTSGPTALNEFVSKESPRIKQEFPWMSKVEVLNEATHRWNATPPDQRPGYAPPGSFHKEFAAFHKREYARLKKEGFAEDLADDWKALNALRGKEIGRLWDQAKAEGRTSRPRRRNESQLDRFRREQHPLVRKQYPGLEMKDRFRVVARRWRGLPDFDPQPSPKKEPISEAQQQFASYNQYTSSQFAAVRQEYPDLHLEELNRIMGRRWRGLSDFDDHKVDTSN